jgi:hypothetical protein
MAAAGDEGAGCRIHRHAAKECEARTRAKLESDQEWRCTDDRQQKGCPARSPSQGSRFALIFIGAAAARSKPSGMRFVSVDAM